MEVVDDLGEEREQGGGLDKDSREEKTGEKEGREGKRMGRRRAVENFCSWSCDQEKYYK